MTPDQLEPQVQVGEGAEPQQVHLEQPQRLHVVLVPLDDGASLHGGVLDRDQGGDRLAAEQKAAGMDRQVARSVADLTRERDQQAVDRGFRVEAGLCEGAGQRHREVAAVVGDEPRHPIQRGGRKAQGLAHVPDRGLGPVADHVGHHGRVLAPVLPVHELDHLLAAPVADVQIDIRRFGTLPGQKALEQQPHAHGIDGGDAQAVAHRGVGSGATPLTEDSLIAAEADDFMHGQEVAAVIEFFDDGQLGIELRGDLLRNLAAIARARAGKGKAAQPLGGGMACGQPLGGVAVAQIGQGKGTAIGYLAGCAHQLGAIGEQPRERLRRLEVMLAVGTQQSACAVQRGAVPDAGDHVLQRAPAAVVVEHLGGGGKGEGEPAAERCQPPLDPGVVGQPVARDQSIEPGAKRLPEPSGAPPPEILVLGSQQMASFPQRDKAVGAVGHLLPANAAFALGTAQAAGGDQLAEVGVAGPALRQQQQRGLPVRGVVRIVGDGDLRADDQTRRPVAGCLPIGGLHVGTHHAVDPVAVGQDQCGNVELAAVLHELLRVAGPFQEGEIALAPQRHIRGSGGVHSTHPCRYQRPDRRS